MSTANLLRVTTYADNGAEVPRFTCWRAVIDLESARRYPTEPVTVMIQAIDADDIDAVESNDPHGILFEADLTGCTPDCDQATVQAAAEHVLTAEGFVPTDYAWVPTGIGYIIEIEVAP